MPLTVQQDPEISLPMNSSSLYDDDDQFPLVSPFNPAEAYFFSSDLQTNRVSAQALASQLQQQQQHQHMMSTSSALTTATDDFHSTAESETEFDDKKKNNNNKLTSDSSSLYGKDILIKSLEKRPSIIEQPENDPEITNMSTSTEEDHVNAAQSVYGTAKNVWTWGKSIPVIGFMEGVTEAVASKVVGLAGSSLEEVDNSLISPNLAGLDSAILNPVVETIVGYLMGGVSNVHGAVEFITGGDDKEKEASTKEEELKEPEITSTTAPAVVKA